MIERDFFIEILKVTPTNSIVETTGYVDIKTAIELELISFKEFVPNSVGLTFKIDLENKTKWIDYFKNADISDLLTHYWIYKDNRVIANGFDFFEINTFDKDFYANQFQKYINEIQLEFENKLTKGIPYPKRIIEFLKTNNYKGNYSCEITTEINDEKLNLRFAIEKQDFETLSSLIAELNSSDKLLFKGAYSSNKEYQELVITVKRPDVELDLMINSTRRLISNLLWFQGLENKSEIEKLIIKSP